MKSNLLHVAIALCLHVFTQITSYGSRIDDPIAYLSFDDIDGNVVPTQVGGQSGEIIGNVAIVEGEIGDAVRFEHRDCCVNWGTFDVSSSSISIACWFKADGTNDHEGVIISKSTGEQPREHDWMLSTSRRGRKLGLDALLKIRGIPVTVATSGSFLEPHVWYHVALTYDASWIRLYLNGEEVKQKQVRGELVQSDAPISIGNEPTLGRARQFNGAIDEARVYDRALSREDIIELTEYVGYLPPVAGFESSPDLKFAGNEIQFDASVSIEHTEPILSYSWDFGDGFIETTTDMVISHVFSVAGSHVVELTVRDSVGTQSVFSTPINIFGGPESDPIYSDSVASSLTEEDLENWNETYSWGNHAAQAYLTSEIDGDVSNELVTGFSIQGTSLILTEADYPWSVDLSLLINDADANPLNETNLSLSLNGSILTLTDAAGSLSEDLGSILPVISSLQSPDGSIENVVYVTAQGITLIGGPVHVGGNLGFAPDEEILRVNGSITIGDYGDISGSNPRLGSLRFDGTDLLGFVLDDEGNQVWRSLSASVISEEDPFFLASPSFNITAAQITSWDTPFVESDPIFATSVAATITGEQVGNWDTTFSWGDHHQAGYLLSEEDGSVSNETITALSLDGSILTITEAGETKSVDLSVFSQTQDGDPDPFNETNLNFDLNGTVLSLTDSAGTISQDLGSIIPSLSSLVTPNGDATEVLRVEDGGAEAITTMLLIGENSVSTNDEVLHVSGDVVIEGELSVSGLTRHGDVYMGQFGRLGDQSPSDDI